MRGPRPSFCGGGFLEARLQADASVLRASIKINQVDGVAAQALEFKRMQAAQFVSQAVDLGELLLNAPATVAVWIRPDDLQNDRRNL